MRTRAPIADKYPSLWARVQAAGRAFLGPGEPVGSSLAQAPEEDGAPRERRYTPGQNSGLAPRADEPGLTAFESLRALAANWDVAALCIHHLQEELAALDWQIVPADGQDKTAPARLAGNIKRVTSQLQKPDGDLLLDQWVGMLAGEDLEIGMPVVYRRKTKGGKWLGADIIQGDTIKPLLDVRGKIGGFQQIWNGIPNGVYTRDQILCMPRFRRRGSAYGIAPLERVIVAANTAMRRQAFDLAYYTEGNIPEALMGAPEGWTPTMVKEFQLWFDTLFIGDDAQRRRLRMFPGDPSKIFQFKQPTAETAQQEWLMKFGCATFSVKPTEIGFTHGVNRGVEKNQQEGQQRTGVMPLAHWVEDVLTQLIQIDMREPDLQFSYGLGGKAEDQQAKAETDDLNIKNRIYSAAYVRERDSIKLPDGDPLLTEPAAPDPAALTAPLAAPTLPEDAPLADSVGDSDPAADPTAPAGNNVLMLQAKSTLRKLYKLRNALAKAGGPGSRGGKFYVDAKGVVRYGEKPVAGAPKPTKEQRAAAAAARHKAVGERKATNAATRAARHKAVEERKAARAAAVAARKKVTLARQNARDELRNAADMPAIQAKGWQPVGEATGYGEDRAAANEAAQAAGLKDPKNIYATVKVNGQYFIVSKPITALQAARAANVTSGGSHKQKAEATAAGAGERTGGGGSTRVQAE